MNDLYKNGYRVYRNAVSKKLLNFIALQINMQKDYENFSKGLPLNSYVAWDPNQKFSQGDEQVPNAYSFSRTFCTESFLMTMLPFMEAQTNKKLLPTYSYGRIYFQDAVLQIHKDRPSCEFSATLPIQTHGQEWSIYFQDLNGKVKEVVLNEGDICIYWGTEVNHWREKFKGNSYMQLFLHYVDKNGPHADWAFDKRPMLGAPAETALQAQQEKLEW
jgi:hypothetical protein